MSSSLWPHGLYSLWHSSGQNTAVGSRSLLQGIFPTQGSNPGLLHGRQILNQLSHKGSPKIIIDYFNNKGKWQKIYNVVILWVNLENSVQFSCSVVSDSLRTHGLQHARFPVHHHLPEFTQTHVHWVRDAIQTSHPLQPPIPFAFNLSQHQGLFKWVSASHQVAKVLEFQLQHQSFQWIFRTDFLSDGLAGFPCSPRDSRESTKSHVIRHLK